MANNNHFELTLDTIAPTGSVTAPQFMGANGNLTIVGNGEPSHMYVWFDSVAQGVLPSDLDPIAFATTYETKFVADGSYYYHVVLMDNVGNKSEVLNTGMIKFDTVKPVVSGGYIEDPNGDPDVKRTITNQLENNYGFEFEDPSPASGVVSARIVGDDIDTINLDNPSSPFADTFSFKEGTEDGTKTITIYVTDAAGNESIGATASIELDRDLTKPNLALKDEDGAILPDYINYHDIKANLVSGAGETDIVGYKIWEGDNEPEDFTKVTKGALNVTVDLELSANDGLKTVHAKVKDSAGNIAEADAKSVTIDTVKPVVAISSDKDAISNIAGYDKAILTLTGTDATADVKAWNLKCGETSIGSGEGAVPATFELTSAKSMVEGLNTLTLEVTDNAENVNSASCTVRLDTTAPTVTINQLNEWYGVVEGRQFNSITVNTADGGVGMAQGKIYAWTNLTAADETVPSGTTAIDYASAAQVISDINKNLQESANNYVHVKVVDRVGNAAFAHAKFGYDSVVPEVTSFAFEHDVYGALAATLLIEYTDATSGVEKMKVTGAGITDPDTDFVTCATSRAVTLKEPDGMKSASIQVMDKAGNVSTVHTAETELDRSAPVASIVLCNPGTEDAKDNPSPVAAFDAHISYTDDAIEKEMQYLFYGPGIGVAEAAAEWKKFSPDMGKGYQTIAAEATEGDGDKIVYVKFKDAAGNISDAASAQFELDTELPEVVVSGVDYNRISKVDMFRLDGTGAGTVKCRHMNFVITPSEKISAFKICAYEDKEAAAAGSHEDAAIGTANGSVNMAGTGLDSDAAISCKIDGADYEIAIGGKASETGEFDGAHIVVAYVADMGGNWSVAAEFAA